MYLGGVISKEEFAPEVQATAAQIIAVLVRLKPILEIKTFISGKKRTPAYIAYVPVCMGILNSRCRTSERILAVEMRCFRRLLDISYRDNVPNEEIWKAIRQYVGWCENLTRPEGLSKNILQDTVEMEKRRGRQRIQQHWINREGLCKDLKRVPTTDV